MITVQLILLVGGAFASLSSPSPSCSGTPVGLLPIGKSKHKKFNEIVTEYFCKNFGTGGVAYLNKLVPRDSASVFSVIDDAAKPGFENEIQRIVDVFDDTKLFRWTKKDLGNVRYRVHRLLGLIELSLLFASSPYRSSSPILAMGSTNNSLNNQPTGILLSKNLDYTKFMGKSERTRMDYLLHNFKLAAKRVPETMSDMVSTALTIIGRLSWDQSRAIKPLPERVFDFVTNGLTNYDPECLRTSNLESFCRIIPELFTRAIATSATFPEPFDGAYARFEFLFSNATSSGVPNLGSQLRVLYKAMRGSECSGSSEAWNPKLKSLGTQLDSFYSYVLSDEFNEKSVGHFTCNKCEVDGNCSKGQVGSFMQLSCEFYNSSDKCAFLEQNRLETSTQT